MEHGQYVAAELGVGFEQMPIDGTLSRADRVLELPPILPLRVVKEE